MRALLIVLLMATGMQAGFADTLYRWVDKEGKVHYGDRPADDAIKSERKKFAEPADTNDEDLPYAARQARQNFPVVLYVGANCGQTCEEARNYLDKRGIPYSEKKITTKEEITAAKSSYGINMVPSLTVGKTGLNGYLQSSWENELDLAGYPKSAGYRKPKAAKPKPATEEPNTNSTPQ